MAIIRLGVVVTGLAGSVGGSTFRRFPYGTTLQRRSAGGSKSKLLQNTAISENVTAIQRWALLSPAERTAWGTAASGFPFPDKFGVLRPLSGRLFYIKIACQAVIINIPTPDPATITSTVTAINFQLYALSISTGDCVIRTFDTYIGMVATVQVALINNLSVNAPITRRKVIAVLNLSSGNTFPFYESLMEHFPFITPGQSLQVWLTPYNGTAYKGFTVSQKDTCT